MLVIAVIHVIGIMGMTRFLPDHDLKWKHVSKAPSLFFSSMIYSLDLHTKTPFFDN